MNKEAIDLIQAIEGDVDYWSNVTFDPETPQKEIEKRKLEGLAHSILTTLDGLSSANDLTRYKIVSETTGKTINEDINLHDLLWNTNDYKEKSSEEILNEVEKTLSESKENESEDDSWNVLELFEEDDEKDLM